MSGENTEAYDDLGLYDGKPAPCLFFPAFPLTSTGFLTFSVDFDTEPAVKADPDADEAKDEGAVANALEADDSASWRPLGSGNMPQQQQQQQQQQAPQGYPSHGRQNAPAPIPTFATQSETSNFALPPNNTRYQNQGGNRYSQQGPPERRYGDPEENDEG